VYIILSVALVMVIVAPFLGRWRAKVWLKKNGQADRKTIHLSQPELRRPNI
jgi:hypothetical protein